MGELPSQTSVNSFITFVLFSDVPDTDVSANQRHPPNGTCIILGEGDSIKQQARQVNDMI